MYVWENRALHEGANLTVHDTYREIIGCSNFHYPPCNSTGEARVQRRRRLLTIG